MSIFCRAFALRFYFIIVLQAINVGAVKISVNIFQRQTNCVVSVLMDFFKLIIINLTIPTAMSHIKGVTVLISIWYSIRQCCLNVYDEASPQINELNVKILCQFEIFVSSHIFFFFFLIFINLLHYKKIK